MRWISTTALRQNFPGRAKVEIAPTWGFIGKAGKFIIQPQYYWLGWFSDGLAEVHLEPGGGQGYIDKTGNMVISAPDLIQTYGGPLRFQEGLAGVEPPPGGKQGFVDKTGAMVIPAQYEIVGCFSEGLAAVCQEKKWGFIDRTGKFVIPAQFNQVGSFSEGLAPVKSEAEQKWGFIDRTGKLAIPYAFTDARDFAEERAWVVLDGKAGIIDPTGKVTFTGSKPPEGHWSEFTGGLARAYSQGKWGYVDKSGQFLIEPRFDYAWDFSGPTAAVHLGERSLVIDRTGKVVVEMELPTRLEETFDGLTSFHAGRGILGFCGCLRQDGHPPRFYFSQPPLGEVAPKFSEGLGRMSLSRTSMASSTAGESWSFRPVFDGAGNFAEGLAPAAAGHRMVLIDKNGKVVKESPLGKASGDKRKSSE